METLTVTSDLRIEVNDSGETPLLCIYSEGMRADGEAGVVVWPCEIRSLIEALATAAGLLAQGVGKRLRYCECCGVALPAGAKPFRLDKRTTFWLCERCAAASPGELADAWREARLPRRAYREADHG